MSIILCIKNYDFSAKNDRKTSSCPITKPKVYFFIYFPTDIKNPRNKVETLLSCQASIDILHCVQDF